MKIWPEYNIKISPCTALTNSGRLEFSIEKGTLYQVILSIEFHFNKEKAIVRLWSTEFLDWVTADDQWITSMIYLSFLEKIVFNRLNKYGDFPSIT